MSANWVVFRANANLGGVFNVTPVFATGIEEVQGVEKGIFNRFIPEDSIVDDLLLPRYVGQNLVVSFGVAIT